MFGNDKKKAAGKAEHLNDKAPKNVVKHTDPPKGPVKNMEKPAPGKQKPTEINSKAPDTDIPNAPATKHTPEMKNTDPAPSNTNVEKLEKDIHPENSPVDKADAPKDQKVANGEKEPQSAVLNDDPNIEESNLKDLKKYEDNVDPSTKKKMKDKADGEVEKGPNHNSKTKALVMARIIAETNDKADTPVTVLMGELAALKAMKGVTGFGYKNGNAPGEFRILMYGSEYTVDQKYTTDKEEVENAFDENGKLKKNVTYTTGEHQYKYETDEFGRISKANAEELKLSNVDRLPHSKNSPGKLEGDHAGHVFGDRFGGSPTLDNIVSQASNVNLSKFKKIENNWAKEIKKGKKVEVDIEIEYINDNLRPSRFIVRWKIDGRPARQIIDNVNAK